MSLKDFFNKHLNPENEQQATMPRINIISNSVRFISKNGKIKLEIRNNKNNIDFFISDNGCGVKEEIIDKIFNPLFTTDNSRKNSGLGLSIVKETILFHRGKIKAYNNVNGGLTIEFSIPKKEKQHKI